MYAHAYDFIIKWATHVRSISMKSFHHTRHTNPFCVLLSKSEYVRQQAENCSSTIFSLRRRGRNEILCAQGAIHDIHVCTPILKNQTFSRIWIGMRASPSITNSRNSEKRRIVGRVS
uniref:Uncharacterized protein n=1 Tax=Bactrocera latifrons TaxID=174628 RepID=A0A0K8UL49_BACLA